MKDIADKKVDKAMDRLEDKGKVHEIAERGERLNAIKEDYTGRNLQKYSYRHCPQC